MDVDLDPGEDAEALELLVQRGDLVDLRPQRVGGLPADDFGEARVVGDRDVLETARLRGGDHLFKRRRPVGRVGVDVQVAAEVADLDQLRQAPEPPKKASSISPAVLAQFGRDRLEPERPIDAVFVLTGKVRSVLS